MTLNTGALAATAVVKLGDGNDSLTLTNAPTAGATIDGGAGTDTLGLSAANYATFSGYTDAQRALVSNFEVLKITDALAGGSTTDISKLTGATSFIAGAGVAAGGTATVSKLGANASVEIAGNNTAVAAQAQITEVTLTGTTDNALDFVSLDVGGITFSTDAGIYADGAAIAANLAGKINANAAFSAVAAGNVVTITAAVAGTAFVVANPTATSGGGAADTFTIAQTTPTPNIVAAASGALVLTQATDTAADAISLKLNNNYTENNDATATITALTHTVTASKIETLNVESTGKASTAFLGAAGNKADGVNNTLALTNDDLVTLNVTGNQAFTFTSAAGMTKLATIDASAVTAGTTISAAAHVGTSAALTIKGSATEANTITGGATADVIVGGAKADVITSSAKADTITLGGGNDTYILADATHSTVSARDVITDFSANKVGQGVNGAATTAGAAAANMRNGDVIDLSAAAPTLVNVAVFANASDATTFLANSAGAAAGVAVNVALDSSTGALYVDMTDNGIADSFIQLTGVTTIDAAAFIV